MYSEVSINNDGPKRNMWTPPGAARVLYAAIFFCNRTQSKSKDHFDKPPSLKELEPGRQKDGGWRQKAYAVSSPA
jgi:hypothetical protein